MNMEKHKSANKLTTRPSYLALNSQIHPIERTVQSSRGLKKGGAGRLKFIESGKRHRRFF
jgi:hypothetical protein